MNTKIYASQDWVSKNAILPPNTAAVGQILSVKSVDENGKPTEWELVTLNPTIDDNEATLPSVTQADNGKFLRVVDGVWAASTIPNAEGASF